MFWNAIGIDANYNMKRERLITAEVDKNLMSLKVPIETILETLNADLDKTNEIFGTDYHAILNPEFVVTSPQEDEPQEDDSQVTQEGDEGEGGDNNIEGNDDKGVE